MANMNWEETRARRQRQYELDRITARYEEEYRAGKSPRLEDYLQRYPEFATELKEFALYFHTIARDLPAPDLAPAGELAPAAQKALAEIFSPPSPPPISGLLRQGVEAGYPPMQLAEALGLSWDILAKLEARVILAASIPPRLIQRIAETLRVTPEAVTSYLRGVTPAPSGAFYYADQAPQQQQESFLNAIQASPELPAERKREWLEIIQQDAEAGS